MSKGVDVCLNEYLLQRNDYLRMLNPETMEYGWLSVHEVLDDNAEFQRVRFIVKKTAGGWVAGMSFEYTIPKNAPESEKIRATVWPPETTSLEEPDFLKYSLEEYVLHKMVEYLTPLALRNKGIQEKTFRAWLRLERVLPPDLPDKDVIAIIGRAIALAPNRFKRKSGWLRLTHVLGDENIATPSNLVSTGRVVDKKRLLNGIIEVIESGIFGPIEWRK